jgi:hypothetical protein
MTGWWLPAKKPEGPGAEVVWELPRLSVTGRRNRRRCCAHGCGGALPRPRTGSGLAWPDPRGAQPSGKSCSI